MRDTALHYPNILFDLNDTLTDPREGVTCLMQFALACLGIDEPGLARLEHFVGPPLSRCFMQTYDFDEARAREAVDHYRECFRATSPYENHVFDGIPELLETLVGRGRMLYVTTSKPSVFAREIARHFAFDRHFKATYSGELDDARMHKGELTCHLFDSEGLTMGHCLMVGDHIHDLLDASRNGATCIGVDYDFDNEDELRAYQPTRHCADLIALRQMSESH